jgi:hypothetical protein
MQETEVAPELRGLRRPIVGFWGAIHEWVDLELFKHLARRHPEWSIVLIGTVSVDTNEDHPYLS